MKKISLAEFMANPPGWLEATAPGTGEQVAVEFSDGKLVILGNGPIPQATEEELAALDRETDRLYEEALRDGRLDNEDRDSWFD